MKPKTASSFPSKLSSLVASSRKAEAKLPKKSSDAILFWGTSFDKSYLPQLKPCVGSATTYVRTDKVTTIKEVQLYAESKNVKRIISTSVSLLSKLLAWDKKKAPSLANYAGSYFLRDGIEYVFIQPLKQLATTYTGKFMAKRMITKLTKKDTWYQPTEFNWHVAEQPEQDYALLSTCDYICVDIETFSDPLAIRCVSYTGFWLDTHTSVSITLPIDTMYNYTWMKKFNELPQPKILQNGKYDISYLARFNAPLINYQFDTAHMFHSWYSELPKDLGFLNSFFIRESAYWKDLSETNDLYEYYRYNSLDTWGTGNCFFAMILEAPEWAIDNYKAEFPTVFPCHLAEMTGIARDMDRLKEAFAIQQEYIAKESASLSTMLGVKNFNVASPKQMKQLLEVLGCKDLKSTDEKNLKKAMFRHPLNARILDKALAIRKARKLLSTYLTEGKELGDTGRMLYALNPHGTDTSRLASKSHHFWCGVNIQNIPRGPKVKSTYKADPGFKLCEVDLEQAESRDTAYISGDLNLIEAVENSPDFHSYNASNFFGVPFKEIYDALKGVVLNKPLRQLAKPVNHGANYNMGAYTLIDTMGLEKIYLAKSLLGLDRFWGPVQVAEYLLEQFHKTYPSIREVFYKGVVEEILRSNMLTHHLVGEKGLTRYCFGNPVKNKSDLNAYIAHPPQSLNARTLNKAWLSVFLEVALPNPKDFKLIAQVHDSILFQHRIGREDLIEQVKVRMEIPVTVRAYDGQVRTFTVPADASASGDYWSECK